MGQSIFSSMMGSPVTGGAPSMPGPMSGAGQFANPIQKAAYIMQAMQNPAAFVKQQFPDIPENIQHNPQAILGYLQQTRGISNQQIQQIQNTYPAEGAVK